MVKIVECDGECGGTYTPRYQVEYVDGNISWLCNECLKSMCFTSEGLHSKVFSVKRF